MSDKQDAITARDAIEMLVAQATSALLRVIAKESNVTVNALTVQDVLDYISAMRGSDDLSKKGGE